jgi:hypothetical protein
MFYSLLWMFTYCHWIGEQRALSDEVQIIPSCQLLKQILESKDYLWKSLMMYASFFILHLILDSDTSGTGKVVCFHVLQIVRFLLPYLCFFLYFPCMTM